MKSKFLASAVALAALGMGVSAANAGVIFDFEFAAGGKSLVVDSTTPSSIAVDVYAYVTGTGAGAEGFQYGYFGVGSQKLTSNVDVDITSGTLAAPFNDAAQSFTPAVSDFSADGIVDWGKVEGARAGAVKPNASAMIMDNGANGSAIANGWKFKVATFTIGLNSFTAAAAGGGDIASVKFVPLTNYTGVGSEGAIVVDGTNTTVQGATTLAGTGVTLLAKASEVTDIDPVFGLVAGIAGSTPDDLHVNTTATGGVTSDIKPMEASAAGSIEIAVAGASSAAGPTYVMLWLTGNDLDKVAGVTASDPELAKLTQFYNPTGIAGFKVLKYGNGLGAAGSGSTFTWDFGTTDLELVAIAAVPEPASLGLLALGAMGLLTRRRK